MSAPGIAAFAVHIGADIAAAGPGAYWPLTPLSRDTARRITRLCWRAGITAQRTLTGPRATIAAVQAAIAEAVASLGQAAAKRAGASRFVISFSGHCVRGDGPVGSTRWCLHDGGLQLADLADQLAQLPVDTQLVIICDSCHASAVADVLHGPQPAIVLASCGEDQTMLERERSEFAVRLERGFRGARPPQTLDELRELLADDTPDCERPVVWTNQQPGSTRALLPAAALRRNSSGDVPATFR
jgi:hypothetical protein